MEREVDGAGVVRAVRRVIRDLVKDLRSAFPGFHRPSDHEGKNERCEPFMECESSGRTVGRDSWNVAIAAIAAVVLVFMVLLFVTVSPWLLYGVSALLWAIAATVRAIHGNPGDKGEGGGGHGRI
jgi:hypothetical protein